MKRRIFIHNLSIIGVGLTILPISCISSTDSLDDVLCYPDLLFQILNIDTIRQIGKTYIHQNSTENSIRTLKTLILVKKDKNLAIKNTLKQQIKDDFTNGNTLNIDGWILSKTEARQCALFYLLNK